MGAIVWIKEVFKAESEIADLWQPKWNENQSVLSTAIHTPERDTGPIEGAAGITWFIEIVEKSLAMVCYLLVRDKLMECANEEIVWEMPVQVSQTAIEGRWHCWVTCRGWSHHHSLSPPTCQHQQLNSREAGPPNVWHTELQSRTPGWGAPLCAWCTK